MRALLSLAAAAALLAGPALADPAILRANPQDADGRVTLGDIFENAGAAAEVLVAERLGPAVVLQAAEVQARARAAGLDWSNERGLRRVVVRRAPDLVQAAVSATPAEAAGAPVAARQVQRSTPAGDVIGRNDMVQVAYVVGGIRLTVTGRAQRAAAMGEAVPVLNLQSGRVIDAVAAGPGRALAGPAALQARADAFVFASR